SGVERSGNNQQVVLDGHQDVAEFAAAQCSAKAGATSGADDEQIRVEFLCQFLKCRIGLPCPEVNALVGDTGKFRQFGAIRVVEGVLVGIDKVQFRAIDSCRKLAGSQDTLVQLRQLLILQIHGNDDRTALGSA